MSEPLSIAKDKKAPVVLKTPEQEYNEFLAVVQNYERQNPVKFALKKEALMGKLAILESRLPVSDEQKAAKEAAKEAEKAAKEAEKAAAKEADKAARAAAKEAEKANKK